MCIRILWTPFVWVSEWAYERARRRGAYRIWQQQQQPRRVCGSLVCITCMWSQTMVVYNKILLFHTNKTHTKIHWNYYIRSSFLLLLLLFSRCCSFHFTSASPNNSKNRNRAATMANAVELLCWQQQQRIFIEIYWRKNSKNIINFFPKFEYLAGNLEGDFIFR